MREEREVATSDDTSYVESGNQKRGGERAMPKKGGSASREEIRNEVKGLVQRSSYRIGRR
jgi:hypothetical protein